MIVRDNQGKVVGQLEHLRDNQGNTIDTVTSYADGRPAVQILTTRDNQGHVQTRTVLGGKLLP